MVFLYINSLPKIKSFENWSFLTLFSNLDSTYAHLTFWLVINRSETNNLWKFIDEYWKLVYYNRSNLKQVAKVIWVMSNGCPKLLVQIVPNRRYWVKSKWTSVCKATEVWYGSCAALYRQTTLWPLVNHWGLLTVMLLPTRIAYKD